MRGLLQVPDRGAASAAAAADARRRFFTAPALGLASKAGAASWNLELALGTCVPDVEDSCHELSLAVVSY